MSLSKSEDSGISLIGRGDMHILSVGVSTGGVAEIRMARDLPGRHIIATTIDKHGLSDAMKYIKEKGYAKQIELRLEDVSKKLPYVDETFDFIYARLVLHYLSKAELTKTLRELYRVLKSGKKLFVVVRSDKTNDAINAFKYDTDTGYSYYHHAGNTAAPLIKRNFHSQESITDYIRAAGFRIEHSESYEEVLYVDFMRTIAAPHPDRLVEVRAKK